MLQMRLRQIQSICQAILEAEEAEKEIAAFAAMQEELEGLLGAGKLNQLTPNQFRQLQEAGIFKNDPATPGRTEPDAAGEIHDSKPWWPGGSHYIIVEYLGRKMVYECTSEGRTVNVSSPNYPMMNSYTQYSPVVNLVGDFPMSQSNESIWESLIEIPTSQFRWGFAEILYGILPGGASATDIADGRYGMATLHFAQDVAETVLIVGKLAKLSKFSKLSRLATLGERFGKNAKAAYAAIAVTELIGAGVSGVQAGQDALKGNHKQAAINALQALFGVIGFSVSAKEYVAAAEKAAVASQKLAGATRTILERSTAFASITRGSRIFDGRPTAILDGHAELFGRITRHGNEFLRDWASTVFGRVLPKGVKVRIVDGGIMLTELDGSTRSIRAIVSNDRKTLYIVREHLDNPVLLIDEIGHLLVHGMNPNFHHRVSFQMLLRAYKEGRVSLSAGQLSELMESILRAAAGY